MKRLPTKNKLLTIEVEFTDFESLVGLAAAIKESIEQTGGPYGLIEHNKAIVEYHLKYSKPSPLIEKNGVMIIKKK